MENYISARVILLILLLAHCFIAMIGMKSKIFIPAKIFRTLYILEFLIVSAFIAYDCATTPFRDGVLLAVIGYVGLYFMMAITWFGVSDWIIDPNKKYEFMPENVVKLASGELLVDGHITESGRRFYVYVDNANYVKNVKRGLVLIKYKGKIGFIPAFDLA